MQVPGEIRGGTFLWQNKQVPMLQPKKYFSSGDIGGSTPSLSFYLQLMLLATFTSHGRTLKTYINSKYWQHYDSSSSFCHFRDDVSVNYQLKQIMYYEFLNSNYLELKYIFDANKQSRTKTCIWTGIYIFLKSNIYFKLELYFGIQTNELELKYKSFSRIYINIFELKQIKT